MHYEYAQAGLVPVPLKQQLIPGTCACAMDMLVQRAVDTAIVESRDQHDTAGSPAYDHEVLLKVVRLGYPKASLLHGESSWPVERIIRSWRSQVVWRLTIP